MTIKIRLILFLGIVASSVLCGLPGEVFGRNISHERIFIPSAFLLKRGNLDILFSTSSFSEDSVISAGSVTFDRLSFFFSPTGEVQLEFGTSDLDGNEGRVIFNPLLDNVSSADLTDYGIRIQLQKNVPPEPEKINLSSALTVGVKSTPVRLRGPLTDETVRILVAQLIYSTGVTDKLTTHAYFSTGRFTGDFSSGNLNTMGLGADYSVMKGKNYEITFQGNGILNLYSFRRPTFQTVRVTDFNLLANADISNRLSLFIGYGLASDSLSDQSTREKIIGVNFSPDFDLDRYLAKMKAKKEKPAEIKPPEEKKETPAEPPVETPEEKKEEPKQEGTSSPP